MDEFHDKCRQILLGKDSEFRYLVESCEDIAVNNEVKKEIELYTNGLNNFYTQKIKEIIEYGEYIAYNYFRYLSLFYSYASLEKYSINYLIEFRKSSIRTLEIALFLQLKNLNINKIFFNKDHKTFYENLLKVYDIDFTKAKEWIKYSKDSELLDKTIKIYKDAVMIQENSNIYKFKSTVRTAAGYKKEATLYLYLRVQEKSVFNVFHEIKYEDKKDGNSVGGNPFNLIPLDPSPKKVDYEGKIISFINKESDLTSKNNDELYEDIAKSRKKTPTSNEKSNNIIEKCNEYNRHVEKSDKLKISKNEKSSYKEIKLNQAIGHLKAKANLYLLSKYAVPHYKLLARFLEHIQEKESFEYKIIVLSILLGIEYKRLLDVILKINSEIEFVNKIVRVQLTTAYADTKRLKIFKQAEKKVEFELPQYILSLKNDVENEFFKKIKETIEQQNELLGSGLKEDFYSCKTSSKLFYFMLNNFEKGTVENISQLFINDIQKRLEVFLKKAKKDFSKTIKLDLRSLHTFSFFYFKQIHKKSEIDLLFLKNKTANTHAKLSYVQTPKRLYNISHWIIEFMNILNLGSVQNKSIEISAEYSGSDKFIEAEEFKKVLSILINLKFKDKNANLTLRMIYLRFVYAISLVTREYHLSANVQQYSKREKIVFIHEKAKGISTSKRIIPLSDLGVKYVEYFYKLSDCFGINQTYPIIIYQKDKIEDITNDNLIRWLNMHKSEILNQISENKYQEIETFFKEVIFNFGRHIFLSYVHNDIDIRQDYADAMVNHFSNGTQDQGKYSFFDNKQYMKEIRDVIEKIENKYIPFCKFLSEDCDGI